ncbi:MAG TPA: alpha/beta hydrolase, partial [Polyangiaceae bacterium]|nr:alpha/beta hydrolase [Polyangiaceae bacterium]
HVAALVLAAPCFAGCSSESNDGRRPLDDTITSIQITVGDFVFDARAAGPVDGELVLLLHGFPQTSYEWMAQLPALARAGYRAVAPDQRGYSPGARPADVESYNIVALVGDTLGIATALGYERFHLVGHDWGGGVAWGVAGVAPQRVQTLTALSTPHPAALASALADTESCQYAASAYFEILSAPDASLASLAQLGVPLDGVPQDAIDEYFAKIWSNPEALNAALNWYRANVANRVLSGTIGAVTVPTLYIWGTADVTFCRETAEDTANYVDAPYRFVALEGAGHWLPEATPQELNTELLTQLAR